MKTVAFVPIKLNNERLPGKNIKKMSDGTPLLQILLNKLVVLKEECIDEIYVYCSDPVIKEYLPEGITFLQRPKYLDDKHTRGKQIYEEFVKTVDADVYILSHVTSPFVTLEHIRECIHKVKSGEYDSSFCAKKMQTFFWKNNKPVNFDRKNPPRTQDMEPYFTEISTIYTFTKQVFDKYHARTGDNPYICEVSEIESVDIDYEDDFLLAEAIYSNVINRTNR